VGGAQKNGNGEQAPRTFPANAEALVHLALVLGEVVMDDDFRLVRVPAVAKVVQQIPFPAGWETRRRRWRGTCRGWPS
jgi:hypothetical protein